jgi:regulator of cell morphogenesis and NO signaling
MQFAANRDSTVAAAAGQQDWTRAPLSALIGHIISVHHEYVRSELPRLQKQLEVVYAIHRERDAATLAPLPEIVFLMKDELDLHLQKEEAVLFPAIEDVERAANSALATSGAPALLHPIRVMLVENESALSALEQIREITRNYTLPAHGCHRYRELFLGFEALGRNLQCHISLENDILFPRAMALQS